LTVNVRVRGAVEGDSEMLEKRMCDTSSRTAVGVAALVVKVTTRLLPPAPPANVPIALPL
jgi:hypothetical protein